MNDKDEVKG